MKLKYSFKRFIVNGLGADFLRICKIYHYCKERNLQLYMDAEDDWAIVPLPPKNWRFFFHSLDMTNDVMPLIDDILLSQIMNTPVTFEALTHVARELYQPRFTFPAQVMDAVLHVRRGDKVKGAWKEGSFHTLEEYYNPIQPMPKHTVYVMTDSPEVATEAYEQGFIVDMQEIRRDGFVYHHYQQPYSSAELYDEAMTFFKNMNLLVHGKQLVGSNASYFFVVGQLLHGKRGISLSNNLSYYICDIISDSGTRLLDNQNI